MSEVLILHLSHKDENLWNKLVDLLDENGYQISHLQSDKKVSGILKFDGLEIIPERHQVLLYDKEVVLRKLYDEYGNPYYCVDETLRRRLEKKLQRYWLLKLPSWRLTVSLSTH